MKKYVKSLIKICKVKKFYKCFINGLIKICVKNIAQIKKINKKNK
jgi:hypothetical protein